MLVIGFPATLFATNCYVIAPTAGEECLVVDPGFGVLDRLSEALAEHRLRPAAVLLTHGHLDHVFSITPVCAEHGVAATVHAADRYRIVDPISQLSPELHDMFVQQFGRQTWKEPDEVVTVEDGATLTVAGLEIGVRHTPGHTEGSVMFTLPGVPDAAREAGMSNSVVSGDVLFAGSIGRTDLPGGDGEAMFRSLREQVLPLPDDTLVLPGHGPVTTVGREREVNPFLRQAAAG